MTKIVPVKSGVRYGSWTITGEAPPKVYKNKKFRQVFARCDCGFEKILHYNNLKQGKTTKCFTCSKVTHGLSNEPEYYIWDTMLARCNNKNHDNYHNYGGRGVSVCNRWDPKKGGSFQNFISDMGRRPSPLHQLDKEAINLSSMEYGPKTTRWVLSEENHRRTRHCRYIEFKGERMIVAEWARRFNIGPWLICQRLKRGWSVEKALTTPPKNKSVVYSQV